MRTVPPAALLLSGLLVYGHVAAAQSPPRRAKTAPTRPLEEVAIMLSSSEENEVRSALESAAALRPKEVLPLLEERVRTGLTPVLLDVALDTFLLLGDASIAPLLVELSHHRRPEVRVRVLDVYAQIDAKKAEPLALAALGDSDATVRKAAAEALAKSGAKNAFERLKRAFELEVEGAARALGQLAKPSEIPAVVALAGERSIDALSPLLEALLARRDLPVAEKQKVIDAVAALRSDDARAELERLAGTVGATSPELKKSLAQAAAGGAQ